MQDKTPSNTKAKSIGNLDKNQLVDPGTYKHIAANDLETPIPEKVAATIPRKPATISVFKIVKFAVIAILVFLILGFTVSFMLSFFSN